MMCMQTMCNESIIVALLSTFTGNLLATITKTVFERPVLVQLFKKRKKSSLKNSLVVLIYSTVFLLFLDQMLSMEFNMIFNKSSNKVVAMIIPNSQIRFQMQFPNSSFLKSPRMQLFF